VAVAQANAQRPTPDIMAERGGRIPAGYDDIDLRFDQLDRILRNQINV